MNSDPAERAAWIARQSARLAPVLDGRLDQGQIETLLGRVADLDINRKHGDMTPGQVILQWLIELQGFDERTASYAARIIPQVDWSAIEFGAVETAEALGVSNVTVWRRRKAGTLPVHAELRDGPARTYPIFRLSSILLTMAWHRRHPWSRGEARSLPPARLF